MIVECFDFMELFDGQLDLVYMFINKQIYWFMFTMELSLRRSYSCIIKQSKWNCHSQEIPHLLWIDQRKCNRNQYSLAKTPKDQDGSNFIFAENTIL